MDVGEMNSGICGYFAEQKNMSCKDYCEEGRRRLRAVMDKRFREIGLSLEWVDTHSIWEIEDALGIPHYSIEGPSRYPRLRPLSRREIEDNIKYIFTGGENA